MKTKATKKEDKKSDSDESKINVSVTPTKKKPENKIEKGPSIIKDIDVKKSSEEDAMNSTPKLEMSDSLTARLKTPSEKRKVIVPLSESNESKDVDADDDEKTEKIIDVSGKKTESGNIEEDDSLDVDGPEKEQNTSYLDEAEKEIEAEDKDGDKDSDTTADDKASKVKDEPKKEEPDKTEAKPEPKKDGESEEEQNDDDQSGSEEGIVNELAEQAADSKRQKKQEKEQILVDEKIETLVEQKTYEVPIGQLTKKRHSRLFVLLLVLILLASLATVNLLVDAGTIDIGIEPLTDFIPL